MSSWADEELVRWVLCCAVTRRRSFFLVGGMQCCSQSDISIGTALGRSSAGACRCRCACRAGGGTLCEAGLEASGLQGLDPPLSFVQAAVPAAPMASSPSKIHLHGILLFSLPFPTRTVVLRCTSRWGLGSDFTVQTHGLCETGAHRLTPQGSLGMTGTVRSALGHASQYFVHDTEFRLSSMWRKLASNSARYLNAVHSHPFPNMAILITL